MEEKISGDWKKIGRRNMTKEEIIKTIWEAMPNLTVNEARKLYETTINLIKDHLSKGEDVELREFGSFKIREKNPRIGRNPRTGEETAISKRKVVTFKPSRYLRDQILNTLVPIR